MTCEKTDTESARADAQNGAADANKSPLRTENGTCSVRDRMAQQELSRRAVAAPDQSQSPPIGDGAHMQARCRVQLTDAQREAMVYVRDLVSRNLIEGAQDSVSKHHTAMVRAAVECIDVLVDESCPGHPPLPYTRPAR